MGIGHLTKELAKQALGDQVKEAIGLKEGATPDSATPAADNLAPIIMGQVQAMQNACKPDQELMVTCTAANQSIRVTEIFAPSPSLLVLTGHDSDRALTRIVTPVSAAQLVCKHVPAPNPSAPTRVRFATPKPK